MPYENPVTSVVLTNTRKDWGLLLRQLSPIALPAFFNTIFFSLATIIDTAMLGSVGPAAIAAVGIVFQPFLVLGLFTELITATVSVLAAQHKGKGNQAGVQQAVWQSLLLTLAAGSVLLVLGVLLSAPIIAFMKAPADTVDYAHMYWGSLLIGFVPQGVKYVLNTAQVAVGEARKVLWINILASLVNLLLDWLLIEGRLGFPALGVLGAGLATSAGNFAAAIASVWVCMNGRSYIHLRGCNGFRFEKGYFCTLRTVGVPNLLSRLAIRVGVLIMVRLVTVLGTAVFAAYQIVYRLHDFAFGAADALGKACSSLVGQCIGAGRPTLAKKYAKCGYLCAAFACLCITGGILLFSRSVLGLFHADDAMVAMMRPALVALLVFQPFQGVGEALAGALAGIGRTKPKFYATLVGIVFIRPVLTYLLAVRLPLGVLGIWAAIGCDEFFRFGCMVFTYARVKWEQVRAIAS